MTILMSLKDAAHLAHQKKFQSQVLSIAVQQAEACGCLVAVDEENGRYYPINSKCHAEVVLLDHEDMRSY